MFQRDYAQPNDGDAINRTFASLVHEAVSVARNKFTIQTPLFLEQLVSEASHPA